ncbi:hypothetical protein PV328_008090 [Microctonus aethiopoides]|uniref:Uncharacterized protein n=1 Tax=Microctonus aethiopoides TaxID=144406 RepID=A0AA39CAM3_9HYME|nr:hypothetical protein PV328_008090 [Microctonus aethiopoides]
MLKGGAWCASLITFMVIIAIGAWIAFRFGRISHLRTRSDEMKKLNIPILDNDYDDNLQAIDPTHDPRSYDIKKQKPTTAKPINQNLFESLQIASDDLEKQPKHSSVEKNPPQFDFPKHSVLIVDPTKATRSR